jgi:hypothetical protein
MTEKVCVCVNLNEKRSGVDTAMWGAAYSMQRAIRRKITLCVIAGLVPAISTLQAQRPVNRDGRDKPGHDGE